MMSVCKTYSFAASHQLPNHKGKCSRLHGHNYRVEIEVTGPVKDRRFESDYGMVMDFGDIDDVIDPIIEALDHRHLNDVLPAECQPTTAEHLALYIVSQAATSGLRLARVRVWETDKAWAEWRS